MPRRILEGKALSTKQDKTVTVLVERRFMHPIYKKYVKKSKKFSAHDEMNAVNEGDKVQIIECAPISKNKRWTIYNGEAVSKAADAPKKVEAKKAAPKKTAAKSDEKPEVKKAPAKKATAKKTTTKTAAKKTTAKKDDK